jgi:hypothetical protein
MRDILVQRLSDLALSQTAVQAILKEIISRHA